MVIKDTNGIEELAALLRVQKLKLALAESCTGGLLGFKITSVAGCSAFFKGGIISYHNDVKTDLLGVGEDILNGDGPGAVSKECAGQMAKGARERLSSDIGVSITGIAGPDGGSEEKPIGTVYIAISEKSKKIITEKFLFIGTRNEIREQAAQMAIKLIIKELRSEPSLP